MGTVLMLDLGETLIHDMKVLPFVPEALTAFMQFEDADRQPLAMCLVSDFDMPAPPATAAKIATIFKRYVALLDQLDLRRFFERVDEHVTLSTHAGVRKPDQKIFELAIKRLRVTAKLADCIFITEDEDHIRHCRDALGMKVLQFGTDFHSWSEAPVRVAALSATGDVNLPAALSAWGKPHGLHAVSDVMKGGEPGTLHAQAQQWVPLSGHGLGTLEGVHVQLPVALGLRLEPDGRIHSVQTGSPSREDMAEAASYLRGLVARGELGEQAGPVATHRIETDSEGRRFLRRRGFTAIAPR